MTIAPTSAAHEPGPSLPTRLTAADRERIEASTQRIGRELLERSLAAQPSVVSPDWWSQQAGEWATHDDDLKLRLFRLVDCMPMLDDPAALDRHVREYLDEAKEPQLQVVVVRGPFTGLLGPPIGGDHRG
ncbi:MAG: hypothetical protein EBZ59_11495, partial [Planctomycetia bacterium]|nr:hypothetical protein [Planctomycetia bacterium]